ncbi:MAG: histidine kinase [Arcobacter sp.]|nr:MAG: histidine kinase [Arcobacter sp.]
MHTKVKWSKSISTNLLKWFLLLSLIPIIIISLLSYKNSSDSLFKAASAQLEHSASAYVNFIDNWFHYRRTDISSWSSNLNTINFMKSLAKDFKASNTSPKAYIKGFQYIMLIDRYQTDLIELTRQYDYIYDLFLIDTHGNLLFTVTKEDDLGTNLLHGKYASTLFAKTYEKTLKDGHIHFSDFENYEPSNGGVYGFLTSPIVSEEGNLLGVYAVQIKPHSLSTQFEELNKKDNGIWHYILGGSDLILRTSLGNEKDILHRKVETKQTSLYQDEHVHHHIEAQQEVLLHAYTGPNGKDVIGTHHPINLLGVQWVLISEIDKDKALASSYKLAYSIILITLLAIIFVFLASFLVAKRITKPIQLLADASEAISSGQRREPVWIEDDNELGQFTDTFNDMIEELTANEKALEERSKETQHALFELKEQKLALDAHSIVAITNVKGDITYVNDKFVEISGYSREELLGKNHRLLQTDEQSTEFWKEMYHTVSNGKIWHNEVKNKAKDGSFYWVDTTIVPFFTDPDATIKKPDSYIAIRTDVTQQKEDEIKLIQAKEDAEAGAIAKAEFLASMSHEIRTPMNGVLGMLGLLKNSKLNSVQAHQVGLAESSAESLLALINDILDFSKVEAGKMDLENLEFNLRDVIGDFAQAIGHRAQENGVELIIDLRKIEHKLVICDPGRLRQILNNLVGNAIKFTHKGEILITGVLKEINDTQGRLFISVQDSGIGIPKGKIDTLFESFTQVDASTTRKYGGTGLGLSITKKLVHLMQGSVSVSSVEGQGATFSFDILVGLPKDKHIVMPSVDIKDKNILIIDDNALNREILSQQLVYWGINVFEAKDANEALELCKKSFQENRSPFDIAIVDMHMPDMDGAELGEKLKDMYQDMKLVMMTSLGNRGDAKTFKKLGFSAFFPKPCTTKDLFHALNVLIDNDQALHDSDNFISPDNLHAMDEKSTWPKSTRILLVEDNMTNQIVANGILETFGLEADTANDGEEALYALKEALKTKPYTLILMDCQMPVLDGYGATEAIRKGLAGDENTKIPIVAMTANAMQGDKEKCLNVGMDDYLSKPINPDKLQEILKEWLA